MAQKQAIGRPVKIKPGNLKRFWSDLVHSRTAYLFLAPTVIIMAVLVVWPLLQGLLFAFTNVSSKNIGNKYIGDNYIAPTYKFSGLDNFFDPDTGVLSTGSPFWGTLRQTLVWVAANVILHFALGLGLALVLNRKFTGRSIYRVLLMIPWAVPSYISALGWSWIFNQNTGLINNTLRSMGLSNIPWSTDAVWATIAVIIVNVWLGVPFYIVTMLGGMQSIPTDLYEASSIDGATKWQNFWQVTLPLLQPVVLTATLLDVIWTFQNFNVIFLTTGGAPAGQTDILVTKSYLLFQQGRYGESSAYSVVMLLMLLIFSIFYTRALRNPQEAR
ncbi:MAG: sugar ABC transporter permease [Chloroflexota bacterium]